MKKREILTVLAAAAFALNAAAQGYAPAESRRLTKTVNTEWTFNYFPREEEAREVYASPSYDDSAWSYVCVPHTWQTYETTRELHPYIRNVAASDNPYWWNGWGWYRKRIDIGREYAGRRIRFEFDGVQKYARIYLNGKYLGDHKGGFTSFYADATDAVNFGGENILAVAVQNSLDDKYRIPPMNAGNWAVYGGIVRDVRLVVTDPVNVPFQGSYKHEGGTFITTPEVSEKQAAVRIRTYVQNQRPDAAEVTLRTVVTDAEGNVCERLNASRRINAGQIAEFDQSIPKFRKPQLWSPDSPYIYNAYSEVYVGKELVDTYHSTFGIRSVAWDYDLHRLVLNGKVTHLHGINRHEEFPWLGHAFPKWIAQRDMEDMKFGLDINYMRTAHYPNDPSVYRFMDRHGICINEELPNIKNQNFSKEVQEQNCREMIRRDRNHPSIVIWSMGNETDHACDSRYAAEEDPTRIVTVRQPYNDSYNPEFCKHTDKEMPVESYLRCTIRGWYDKDDMNLEPSDGQWAGTEYWQHKLSRNPKKPISEHNGTVWLYADHGADREYVGAPLKHVNPKGWVDSWRTPKYVYYLGQANFSRKPMVHIQPHFWRSQYVGQKKLITVDSNCAKVELYVNGKKIGEKKPDVTNDFCVEFPDVAVEQGVIEAVATHRSGTVVKDRVVMSGEPAALTISLSADRMMSTADNLVEFKVDIVDKEGVHVYGANNTLKFHVEGPATLVGPDVYISDRDKHEEYEGTMYIDAPVINLIRAVGKTGTVTVTASATGLEPASATVEVVDYADPAPLPGISEPRLSWEGRQRFAGQLRAGTRGDAPLPRRSVVPDRPPAGVPLPHPGVRQGAEPRHRHLDARVPLPARRLLDDPRLDGPLRRRPGLYRGRRLQLHRRPVQRVACRHQASGRETAAESLRRLHDQLLREDDRTRRQGHELHGRLRTHRPHSRGRRSGLDRRQKRCEGAAHRRGRRSDSHRGARPSRTRHAGQRRPEAGLQTHHGRQSVGDVQEHPQQEDQDPHRLLHREAEQRGPDPRIQGPDLEEIPRQETVR